MTTCGGIVWFVAIVVSALLGAGCQTPGVSAQDALLVQNVHVVDLSGRPPELSEAVSIFVRGGVIKSVDYDIPAPQGVRTVDGRGGFVIPGLIDAHVHLKDRAELDRYIASGVTTVRNMRGEPRILSWRDAITAGSLTGPTIVSASPTMFGQDSPFFHRANLPDTARADARQFAVSGYDLLKVYRVDRDVLEALINEGRSRGLAVSGHYPDFDMSLSEVAASGMLSIEHIHELFYAPDVRDMPEGERISHVVQTLRGSDLMLVTTLQNTENINRVVDLRDAFLTPELRATLGYFVALRSGIEHVESVKTAEHPDDWKEDMDSVRRLVKALADAGVPIVVGTDAHSHLAVAGTSVHDEIDQLLRAGLSPESALRAATMAGARLLGLDSRKGAISPGYDADFVLTAENPLENPSVLRDPDGVMVGGSWYDARQLRRLQSIF